MGINDGVNSGPRALIIDLSTKIGGASIRAVNLMAALPFDRTALACLSGSPVMTMAIERNLKVHVVGRYKLDPGILFRLIQIARKDGIQLFDVQNPQSKFWGALAVRFSGACLVSTLNSWSFQETHGRWRRLFYHWIERVAAPLTDMHIAVSTEIENNLLRLNIRDTSIAVIPNAVDIDSLNYQTPEGYLSNAYNVPGGTTVCCAVGRLAEAKGYPHLINAMARLDDSFVCLIIGGGHLRDTLAKQIAQLGLQKRVFLLGSMDRQEVLKTLNASDIFVMPSCTEGTPIALLEAASLAKPIVATAVGGIPDILTHGKHAKLVAPTEDGPLAEAILWMQGHPGASSAMGQSAKDHIKAHFGMASQANGTLSAYDAAWAKRNRR